MYEILLVHMLFITCSLVRDKALSMEQIENSLGGNICRCTGYRPILDAFKGFASDASSSMVKNILDIEVLVRQISFLIQKFYFYIGI